MNNQIRRAVVNKLKYLVDLIEDEGMEDKRVLNELIEIEISSIKTIQNTLITKEDKIKEKQYYIN